MKKLLLVLGITLLIFGCGKSTEIIDEPLDTSQVQEDSALQAQEEAAREEAARERRLYLQQGAELAEAGQYQDALNIFEMLLRKNPSDSDALRLKEASENLKDEYEQMSIAREKIADDIRKIADSLRNEEALLGRRLAASDLDRWQKRLGIKLGYDEVKLYLELSEQERIYRLIKEHETQIGRLMTPNELRTWENANEVQLSPEFRRMREEDNYGGWSDSSRLKQELDLFSSMTPSERRLWEMEQTWDWDSSPWNKRARLYRLLDGVGRSSRRARMDSLYGTLSPSALRKTENSLTSDLDPAGRRKFLDFFYGDLQFQPLRDRYNRLFGDLTSREKRNYEDLYYGDLSPAGKRALREKLSGDLSPRVRFLNEKNLLSDLGSEGRQVYDKKYTGDLSEADRYRDEQTQYDGLLPSMRREREEMYYGHLPQAERYAREKSIFDDLTDQEKQERMNALYGDMTEEERKAYEKKLYGRSGPWSEAESDNLTAWIAQKMLMADQSLEEGDYNGARNIYNEILVQSPEYARAFNGLGKTLYKENPKSKQGLIQADEYFRKAQSADASLWEPDYYRGLIYRAFRKTDQAIALLTDANSKNQGKADILNALGKAWYDKKEYAKALKFFLECKKIDPAYSANYFTLGLTYLKLDDSTRALEELTVSLNMREDHAPSLYEAGKLHSAAGDYSKASGLLEKAVSLRSGNVDYLMALGVSYFGQDRYDDALRVFEQAYSLNDSRSDISYNLGLVYTKKERYSDAFDALNRAIDKNSGSAQYMAAYADAQEKSGDQNRALVSYEKAYELDDRKKEVLINLGRIYDETGEFGKAEKLLESAWNLHGDTLEINQNLGNVYFHLSKWDKSIFAYQKVLAQDPGNEYAAVQTALAYRQKGNPDEAESILRKVMFENPRAWDAQYRLAFIALDRDDIETAKSLLEDLITKNPDYSEKEKIEEILNR